MKSTILYLRIRFNVIRMQIYNNLERDAQIWVKPGHRHYTAKFRKFCNRRFRKIGLKNVKLLKQQLDIVFNK